MIMEVPYSMKTGWVFHGIKKDKPIMSQRAESLLSLVHRATSTLTLCGIVWILSSISTMDGRLIKIETLAAVSRDDHDDLVRLKQDHRALDARVTSLEQK